MSEIERDGSLPHTLPPVQERLRRQKAAKKLYAEDWHGKCHIKIFKSLNI